MAYPEFPTIFVVAHTHAIANNFINRISGIERRPITVSAEDSGRHEYCSLRGQRGRIIILVNLIDLGPAYSYLLDKNLVIRVTY